jgi:branched-chain amino acid transport system permease protein
MASTSNSSISRSAPGVIYGAILILFLFILPDGVAGLVRRFTTKKRIIPGRETS